MTIFLRNKIISFLSFNLEFKQIFYFNSNEIENIKAGMNGGRGNEDNLLVQISPHTRN